MTQFDKHNRSIGIPLTLALFGLVAVGLERFEVGDGDEGIRADGNNRPESIRMPGPASEMTRQPKTNPVVGVPIPAVRREDASIYRSLNAEGETFRIKASETPRPAGPSPYGRGLGYPVEPEAIPEGEEAVPRSPSSRATEAPASQAPALNRSFDSTDFLTNSRETGRLFIPPDIHAAAGVSHLVNVVNVTIRFHRKDGTLDYSDALADFFASS